MNGKPSHWMFFILISFLSLGCGDNGEAVFEVEDVSTDTVCFDRMFPFDSSFSALRERTGSIGLFFQSVGGNVQNKDLIYVEVFNGNGITEAPIALTKPMRGNENAVAEVEMFRSCPTTTRSYYIDGTLQFTAFSTPIGDRVAGSLDGVVYDLHTDEVAATNLSGDFDFEIVRGPPYEEFGN